MATEPYDVRYRPEVEDDLRRIGAAARGRVLSAVEERIAADPEKFGKPLSGDLAGLRRVRVGDHRVAYQVAGRRVIVWAVLHRKDVYAQLLKRLPR